MPRQVKLQHPRIKYSSKDASNSGHSPYWNDVARHNRDRGGENVQEHPQANPDVLPETKIVNPSTPQLLMGEAMDHLQGRQREVYILVMRDNKSLAEVAKILGLSKGSAQKYKERAIRFVTGYCKQAIAKWRV